MLELMHKAQTELLKNGIKSCVYISPWDNPSIYATPAAYLEYIMCYTEFFDNELTRTRVELLANRGTVVTPSHYQPVKKLVDNQ